MQTYFICTFLLIFLLNLLFIVRNRIRSLSGLLHGLSIALSQSFIIILILGLQFFIVYGIARIAGLTPLTAGMTATFSSAFFASLVFIILILDYKLSQMYGFHINGYVLNVLFTDGGLEALEGGKSSAFLFLLSCLVIISINIFCAYMLLMRHWQLAILSDIPVTVIYVAAIVLLANVLIDKLIYGLARIGNQSQILVRCDMVPFYIPVTFRRIAVTLGYQPKISQDDVNISLRSRENDLLCYPSSPLMIEPPSLKPNLIILPVESWRWDMLTPEIMPKTHDWVSKRGHLFTNHFSTGNATRMALFGLFYGLYPPYWFPALEMRQPPVVMQALKKMGYDIHAYSSTGYTYPEFDKTIFSGIDREQLHDIAGHSKWHHDVVMTDAIIQKMIANKARDCSTFIYGFYNTTHARYDFPEDKALLADYEKHLNYVTTNIRKHIDAIRNRYINSCNFLDSQFDRLMSSLDENGLLANSIVVIFGDHGEEFMDNGAWGHNSSFLDAQTRVPLLMFLPDGSSGRHDFLTSHLDVPATLAPYLGITSEIETYTQGCDMLASGFERRYAVMGAWSTLGILFPDAVYSTPLNPRRQFRRAVTDRKGNKLANEKEVLKNYQTDLLTIMRELGRFRQN